MVRSFEKGRKVVKVAFAILAHDEHYRKAQIKRQGNSNNVSSLGCVDLGSG